MSDPKTFSTEFVVEAAKGTPAVAGAAYLATWGVNEWVAAIVGLYTLTQLAYLIWKWRREADKP